MGGTAMMDKGRALSHLSEALGHRPLSRFWAKAEILLGLVSAGLGMLLGNWALGKAGDATWLLAAGLALFVLGGYLALAGHRSHLYQSNNELAAYLPEEIRALKELPRSHSGILLHVRKLRTTGTGGRRAGSPPMVWQWSEPASRPMRYCGNEEAT